MTKSENNIRALIAVPAYNEEQRIPRMLGLLQPWKKDVLIIDDGSCDATPSLVREAGYSCIRHSANVGLSGFFETAVTYAIEQGFTHLITLDADGQHDPRYIPEFIAALRHYELVSGERFHDLSNIPESKIASNLFAVLLFQKFLNISFPDVACGFRAMNINILKEYQGLPRFGIIYDMLAHHAKTGKQTGFIKIPAIYFPDETMNTNSGEIIGLLSTIQKYSSAPELTLLTEAVKNKTGFTIALSGLSFEAIFQQPEHYRFCTDVNPAKQLFTKIHNGYG